MTLTEEEYQAALVTPLLFAKDLTETEQECMARVRKDGHARVEPDGLV